MSRTLKDYRKIVRDFLASHPDGATHRAVKRLQKRLRLDELTVRRMLEREHLRSLLTRIRGLGPQRIKTVLSRFPTARRLSRATVDELASLPRMPREVARRISTAELA